MTIEIHQPELEALIAERLLSGAFESVEQVLLAALKTSPAPEATRQELTPHTGAALVDALRNSPFYGLDIDFESARGPLPVREVNL